VLRQRECGGANLAGALDDSAYVNHVALARKACGAKMPASFWTDPLMYQGDSEVEFYTSGQVCKREVGGRGG
jgi:hypothetical protein